MRPIFVMPIALATLLLTSACSYDLATGYAPKGYPLGYDSGMGSGLVTQPGDLFGGQNVGSVAAFDAPLAPYGQWVNSRYGRAFCPDVPREWRPYLNGRWGENRLWVSNDPWGWATDHYGRWGFDDRIGWVWAPGTEWAPSWVAFRDDPAQNVSGWAPIPPNVNYSINFGFGSGWGYDSFANWYGPSWIWVPRSFLYQPGFGGRVLPWNYGASYWGGSHWQYQPGWGGRPNIRPYPGNHLPGGNWGRRQSGGNLQGGPRQGRDPDIRYQSSQSWNDQPRSNMNNQPRDSIPGQPADVARIPGYQPWQAIADTSPASPHRERAAHTVATAEVPRSAPQPRTEHPSYEPPPRQERAQTPARASRNTEDSRYERPD